MTNEAERYCPVCKRTLYAFNQERVESGEEVEYFFIHDHIPHSPDDIDAMSIRSDHSLSIISNVN